jgi:sialic acid synthase SpsE/endonuclease IV
MTILQAPNPQICLSLNSTILDAITVLYKTKVNLLFVIDQNSRLIGVVSQGDINAFLSSGSEVELQKSIICCMNYSYRFIRYGSSLEEISNLLKDFDVVPILGSGRRLEQVAYREDKFNNFNLCDLTIGSNLPTCIIAEIGNNHNGDLDLARKMIHIAAEAGADIIKLQMRDMELLYGSTHVDNHKVHNLGTEYLLELLSENQLPPDELLQLFDEIHSLGKKPLCTPWDLASLARLINYGMTTIKVASPDLTNHVLLGAAADQRCTLLCSTGMATQEEVAETARFLQEKGALYYFLHCQSSYPAALGDINLAYMDRLRELSRGGIVGYSSHDLGINVCLAAVARGARIIEKHFTLDRTLKGIDHRVSLLPDEFRQMVDGVREIEKAIGRGDKRVLSQGELINRSTLSKSVVTTRTLTTGHVLSRDDLTVRSPGHGIQPNQLPRMLGCRVLHLLEADSVIYWDDVMTPVNVNLGVGSSSVASFGSRSLRPAIWDSLPGRWGIPVRPHDFNRLQGLFQPQMLEFHLSYRDLSKRPVEFCLDHNLPYCVVHAPELLENEFILDLCSESLQIREASIAAMERVIAFSAELLEQLPNQQHIGIVTNVGGHSDYGFLPQDARQRLIERLAESLDKLRHPNIDIWPQTMPPFPWHFGGQRFHNLFVHPQECIELSHKLSVKLCVDLSHTQLACNHLGVHLQDYLIELLNCTKHLHISDADTENGEGLEINKGSVNFLQVMDAIKAKTAHNPEALSWIPEIWQGHENNARGFRTALDHLCDFI